MQKSGILLASLVIGALGIGLFCGCEGDPDTEDVDKQFDDSSYAGGDRPSTSDSLLSVKPSATSLTNNGAVVSFAISGASGDSTWAVQDISKGSILTQSSRAATYQRAAAGDNVVIVTDSRGNAAFATVSQP